MIRATFEIGPAGSAEALALQGRKLFDDDAGVAGGGAATVEALGR